MKWQEVKSLYPDQWVKLQIIKSHKENNYLYIDDMEVLKPILNDRQATLELTKNLGNSIVFHTSHDIIRTKLINNLGLFRRLPH